MPTMSELYPKYYKDLKGLTEADVYAVCYVFNVNDPSGAVHHALKKLLLPGVRTGGKDRIEDITEARNTLTRLIELLEHFEGKNGQNPHNGDHTALPKDFGLPSVVAAECGNDHLHELRMMVADGRLAQVQVGFGETIEGFCNRRMVRKFVFERYNPRFAGCAGTAKIDTPIVWLDRGMVGGPGDLGPVAPWPFQCQPYPNPLEYNGQLDRAVRRERDREVFTDPEFNKWLDTAITENAEYTVWDQIKEIGDAWVAWQERGALDYTAKVPSPDIYEFVDGTGPRYRIVGTYNPAGVLKDPVMGIDCIITYEDILNGKKYARTGKDFHLRMRKIN